MTYAYFIENTMHPTPVDNSVLFRYIREASISEDFIFIDTYGNRSEIRKLFKHLKATDIIICRSIRDLGDNISQILRALVWLSERHIDLISIEERYFKLSSSKSLIVDLVHFDAELSELSQVVGYQKALQEKRVGRPKREGIEKALQLHEQKSLTVGEICKLTGVSPSTFYRAIRDKKKMGS